MCCRYYMEMSPELRPFAEAARNSSLYRSSIERIPKPLTVEGEVFPGAQVPVLATGRSGRQAVFPMLWGYRIPGLDRAVVNARIETAPEKPSFRDSWAAHRCIIPASWYFEWEHLPAPSGKTRPGAKYAIMPKGGGLTWLCGLYRMEDGYPHFVVLTREPAGSISFIHDRMPFILPRSEILRWIDPNFNPHMLTKAAVTDVVYEKQE